MSTSSRVIDGLKTNTLYSFHVKAKNTMGIWSNLSTVVTHTTLKDTTAPAAPTGLTLLTHTGHFLFNWTKAPEIDVRGGGYKLYVFTANTPASAKLIKEIGYTSEWAMVTIGEATNDGAITITDGVTYWWWLTTIDASGNESVKAVTAPASASVTGGIVGAYTIVSHNAHTILTNADLGKVHIMDVSGGWWSFILPTTSVPYVGYWVKLVRKGTGNPLRIQAGATDVIWNSSVGGYVECDDVLHDYSSVDLIMIAVGQWATTAYGIWSSY